MTLENHWSRAVVAAAATLVTLSAADPAWAQDAQMSAEQIGLLNEANKALSQDPVDLEKARSLIEQALEKGERFDVLLLSLGRTMQKMDECKDAKKIFNEMSFAPHEPSVSKEALEKLRGGYIDQMEQLCSAELTIACASEDTILEVGGLEPACGEPVKLGAGGYEIVATLGDQTKSYDISLRGAEERSFNVSLKPREEGTGPGEGGGVEDPGDTKKPDDGFKYTGTLVSGVTTLVLTGAAAGVWAYGSSGRSSVLEQARADGLVELDGEDYFFTPAASQAQRDSINAEGQPFGTMEVYGGWAVPIVAGVGAVTTAVFFMMESGSESPASALRLSVDPTNGSAYGGVHLAW